MYRKKQKLTHLLTKLIRKGIYPRIEKGIINQDLKKKVFSIKFEHVKVFYLKIEGKSISSQN